MYFPTEYGAGSGICMDIQLFQAEWLPRAESYYKSLLIKNDILITGMILQVHPSSTALLSNGVKVQMKERTHKPMVATAKPIKTHPHLRSKHKYVEEVSKNLVNTGIQGLVFAHIGRYSLHEKMVAKILFKHLHFSMTTFSHWTANGFMASRWRVPE